MIEKLLIYFRTFEVPNKQSLEAALLAAQRKSYKTITSLNALTLRKVIMDCN